MRVSLEVSPCELDQWLSQLEGDDVLDIEPKTVARLIRLATDLDEDWGRLLATELKATGYCGVCGIKNLKAGWACVCTDRRRAQVPK
jgi:hypothetical protein